MAVPFIDFKQQHAVIKEETLEGITSVIERGNFILGDPVKEFEKQFADYCGTKYAVGLNSGTDALCFALSALGIGAGDDVIIPTHTFVATALGVSYAGATPVCVDVCDKTYNISPQAFEEAITEKTKAVIAVHIYGQPADMEEINAVAKKHNIKVIEDAAQAHGAYYKDSRVGSLSDVACFSFYPTKNLGAFGDGGMAVTSDKQTYENLTMLRDYGRVGRYEHIVKGRNSRLDTIQAVGLLAKLKHLDQWNAMRQQVADWYNEELKAVDDVVTLTVNPGWTCVYHLFVVRVQERDNVLAKLQEQKIGSLIHYPIPVHLQPAYKDLGYTLGDLPVAEKIASEIISVPMFPHMTREQVEEVCSALKKALGQK